jgi:hypothetical protein
MTTTNIEQKVETVTETVQKSEIANFSLKDNLYNGASVLNTEDEDELTNLSGYIESFLSNNKLDNFNQLDEMSKQERYKDLTDTWNKFTSKLRSSKFNLPLTYSEFELLSNKITKEIEYTKDTLPFALLINAEYLSKYKQVSFKNVENINTEITIDNLVKVIYLMDSVKVKGLSKSALTYYNIIRKFGEIHKVFNKYDIISKKLGESIQNFVTGIQTNDILEETQVTETKN